MFRHKRLLIGLAGALLLAGGLGAGIAATGDRHGDGSEQSFGPRGERSERMGHRQARSGWHRHDYHGPEGRPGWGGHRLPLTGEELDTRIRERFASLDRNSDGVIDRSEIEAAMAARAGRDGRGMDHRGREEGQQAGQGVRRFDENRDGKVTRDEFRATIQRRFAEMDLDSDGRITDADLPPFMRGRDVLTGGGGPGIGMLASPERHGRHGGRMSGGIGGILAWLKSADSNRDGIITLDEVITRADQEFARLDRNNDGVLDTADRDLMRKQMTDYRVQRFLHRFGGTNDGKITREQFTKIARERWARMADADRDGHSPGVGLEPGDRGPAERGGRGSWRGQPPGETPRNHGAEPVPPASSSPPAAARP